MKALVSTLFASALLSANFAAAQEITLPEAEQTQEDSNVELKFDAATKKLEIQYSFINNNSCSRKATNVKTTKGVLVNEISFDIGSAGSKNQMCLMVLRPMTVVAKVRLTKSSILKINGESVGVIVLSDDGQTASFEPNAPFTTQN